MSESVRMWALIGCFFAVVYVIYAAVDTALSEPLDDTTIRQIYAQADGLVKNPRSGNLGEFLEKRLAVHYARVGNMIKVIPEKPEEITPIALNKAQSIDYSVKAASAMAIKTYEHKIIDIKFSSDNTFAYVSSTESTSGTINPPEGSAKGIPFNSASACIDTLTLVRAVVMFVRSECTNKLAIIQ